MEERKRTRSSPCHVDFTCYRSSSSWGRIRKWWSTRFSRRPGLTGYTMSPARSETQRHYPISGWIEAGLYVFAIAFLSLAYVVGHRLGAHPIAFVLYAMLVSALVLLARHRAWPRRVAHHPRAPELAGRRRHDRHGNLLLHAARKTFSGRGQPAGALLHPAVADRRLGHVRPHPRALPGSAALSLAGLLPLLFLLDPRIVPHADLLPLGLRLQPAALLAVPPWNPPRRHAPQSCGITAWRARHLASEPGLAGAARSFLRSAFCRLSHGPTARAMLHLHTMRLLGRLRHPGTAWILNSRACEDPTENFAATSAFRRRSPARAVRRRGFGLIPSSLSTPASTPPGRASPACS